MAAMEPKVAIKAKFDKNLPLLLASESSPIKAFQAPPYIPCTTTSAVSSKAKVKGSLA
jgi:hypothetical protein